MAYKLKKGIFKVECKHSGCPFSVEIEIKQNIMGMTEDDVESESKKIVKDMALIKHDAMYGSKHSLTTPTVRKISGVYEAIGAKSSTIVNQNEAVRYKEYKKDEIILKKGDIATTICEVVKGFAYVEKNKNHMYKIGQSFGAAALLINQTRTTDVIAGEDGTTIAFFNLKELNKKDPRKSKEIYNEAMEDIFNVLGEMESIIDKLETDLEREKLINENRKERILELEKDLLELNKKIAEKERGDSFR